MLIRLCLYCRLSHTAWHRYRATAIKQTMFKWGRQPVSLLITTSPSHHYSDAVMSVMSSQITGISIVYSTVCPGADQRTHLWSASLAFVSGIHRSPVNSPHKGPVTRSIDVSIWWRHHDERLFLLLQLHVSMESDLVTEYHHEVSLTTASFFGQMGGILNLWIGISFFTIIEIIDLFLRYLGTFAKRQKVEDDIDMSSEKHICVWWR